VGWRTLATVACRLFPGLVCSGFAGSVGGWGAFGVSLRGKAFRPIFSALRAEKLLEAAGITSPYKSIGCAAKRQKCPHRYPQITSPGFLARFRQILTLFRRSPRVESLQRIGAADQGAASVTTDCYGGDLSQGSPARRHPLDEIARRWAR